MYNGFVFFKPARHTKLEKADILEMTVRHLQSLHRNGGGPTVEPSRSPTSSTAAATALTAAVVQKFQTGYQECAGEVNRFVGRLDGVDDEIKKRLMSHLDSCVAKMRYAAAATSASSSYNNNYPLPLLDPAAAAALSPGAGRLYGGDRPPQPTTVRVRPSAFTAVHGPDVDDRSPYVYCDEPAVSSTSSWAEDAARPAVVKHPPLDFSMKRPAAHGKRPLGDIPVNVPALAAVPSSSAPSLHKSAAITSGDAGPTSPGPQRPVPAAAAAAAGAAPCDGSDPNMWRPW